MNNTDIYKNIHCGSPYEKCKKSIADSTSDLTPSGKLFGLKSILHRCKTINQKGIIATH